MIGEAQVKAEGEAIAYDPKAPWPRHKDSLLARLVRAFTGWAWETTVDNHVAQFREETQGAKRYARVVELRLAMLEELFREKQAKIKRLQDAYKERRGPMYEDMRLENPIKDAESLAQSISVLAARAEAYRARTGKPMRVSDGTVFGVPGDKPNVPVGERWDTCGEG